MMKKLLLLLLFIPLVSFGQNGEIDFERNKFNSYLEFINDAMNGSSTTLAISNAKKILKYSGYNNSYNGELMIMDNGENYLKTNEGTYLHVVKNERVNTYLGFDGIGQYFAYIYIYSKNKDFYKDDNIVAIHTRLLFMSRYATDSKLIEIRKISLDSINEFFKNKCTTGLVNGQEYVEATRMGNSFDSLWKFDIMGKDTVIGGIEENNSCISSCENCLIQAETANTNNGFGINEGYSHIFYLGFVNSLKKGMVKMSSEVDDFMYNYNFIIYDYKGKGWEKDDDDNKLDLRKINNYDLKAMINFFIEDYNRYSTKVSDKLISPKIFNAKSILATFETLEGETIALSYGMNNDSKIIIKVDPEKWANASEIKRWYILYHELGHDILNLEHGEGGKMMFNFADREYSWDEFIEDKKYMFENN